MIDIDHFKLYNDHYGHTAGDRCLHRVAQQLATTLNPTQHPTHLIARYGGEEFAVVMPNTTTTTAQHTAEQLRHAIETLTEPHTLTTNGIVTISIGVAALTPTPHTTTNTLIEMADVELYRAKRAGRNQVKTAPP